MTLRANQFKMQEAFLAWAKFRVGGPHPNPAS